MEMNYEKWHDGIGYDLDALDEMTTEDKDQMVEMLGSDLREPWRSFEALNHLNTTKAMSIIQEALGHPKLEVRIAAARFVKGADSAREMVLIEAIEKSDVYAGLTQALDQVETFHPQGVIDALLRGLLKRGDSGAVNFAGMLLFIHGKADSSFDWSRRPLFLKFESGDLNARKSAFVELCAILDVGPKRYLDEWTKGD